MAAESATFGVPEVVIGALPGAGGTERLGHALGQAKAMQPLLTGEPISAQEAWGGGLVARAASHDEGVSTALGAVERIAANAPQAVQMARAAANRAHETSLRRGREYERRNFHLLLGTSDMREGVAAGSEKRKPVFTGH